MPQVTIEISEEMAEWIRRFNEGETISAITGKGKTTRNAVLSYLIQAGLGTRPVIQGTMTNGSIKKKLETAYAESGESGLRAEGVRLAQEGASFGTIGVCTSQILRRHKGNAAPDHGPDGAAL